MTIGTTSIAPRMIPQAFVRSSPVGTRSILNPAALSVSAFRMSERVPSVFDGTTVHGGPGDIFGSGVPDVPSSDRPQRIAATGYGDVSASFDVTIGTDPAECLPGPIDPSWPKPVQDQVFAYDTQFAAMPHNVRQENCTQLQTQRQAVFDQALAAYKAANPTASGPGLAAARAAASAAQDAALRQSNALLQQAQAAQQAAAQAQARGDSVAAAAASTRAKNLTLLAATQKSAATRDVTLPVQTITPGKSNTTLIVGGIAAAAVIGGILYFTLGKKKAA